MNKLPFEKSIITKEKLKILAESPKIILTVSKCALEKLIPLLEDLKRLGDWGASREIKIDEESFKNHFFDGDGSDKIYNIEVKENDMIYSIWTEKELKGV